MSDSELIDLMFPAALQPPSHWEAHYPQRALPEGAKVTRFAPSPTGYLHIGGLYAAMISQDLAHHSGGIFFVRIENTDSAREVADAREQFAAAFDYFSLQSDEAADAPWGPYEQSERAEIYESFARQLVEQGQAYPCFCTPQDLEALAARQKASRVTPGYYGKWACCRSLAREEVLARLRAGTPFAIRFRAPDGEPGPSVFTDLIRGLMEQLDNRNDAVILKSNSATPRLPTYHFAHIVDDHLMRVNLVVRGEEWVPSVPLHLQLIRALGFEVPGLAHIAPLMKLDGSSKRKLSKRKDPEASVESYMTAGYPADAVRLYLRGLANSNLADLPYAEALTTPIALDRMGIAGPVFDSVKLDSISRNYVADLPIEERLAAIEHWAAKFDSTLAAVLAEERGTLLRALELERKLDRNPRKDVAKWQDVLPAYRVYLPSQFVLIADPAREEFAPTAPETVRAVLADFLRDYVHSDDRDQWFEQVRSVARKHGFAPTVGEYKREPEKFAGPISEASNIVRVALTGQRQSTDLFLLSQVVGEAEIRRRLSAIR